MLKQNPTTAGTVSFDPYFLQPTGSEYVASTDLNAKDILTLITFDGTSNIYVAAVNNLV